MGEHLLNTVNCHVFHVDPCTKKEWLPSSTQLVDVCFYHDVPRNIFRIISIENNKVLINSTVHPETIFIKSSHKFGQWTDFYSKCIYGVGFDEEVDLNKFVEYFDEVKKQAAQDIFTNSLVLLKEMQSNDSSVEQMRYENDRLKIALAQSCCNAKKWTVELQMLRNTNRRLKSAVEESIANVEKWNQHMITLKEENAQLKNKICEMERCGPTKEILEQQNSEMRARLVDALEKMAELQKEIDTLKMRLSFFKSVEGDKTCFSLNKLELEEENRQLKEDLNSLKLSLGLSAQHHHYNDNNKLQQLDNHLRQQQLHQTKTTTGTSLPTDRWLEIQELQEQFNEKIEELSKIKNKIASLF